MSAGHTEIGSKGQQAIAALLTDPTHEKAARKAGISLATLQRWLNDPAFKDAYRQARQQAFEGAIFKLEWAFDQAVSKLVQRLKSAQEGDEIRAAVLLLEHAFRARELLDDDRKIAELAVGCTDIGCIDIAVDDPGYFSIGLFQFSNPVGSKDQFSRGSIFKKKDPFFQTEKFQTHGLFQ